MGRASLMMIIAFNVTFMAIGYRMSSATSSAYQKYCAYNDIEQAGLAVESCANMAISHALLDSARINSYTLYTNQQLFGISGSSFSVKQFPTFDAFHVQQGESLQVSGSFPLTGSSSNMTFWSSVQVTGNSFSQYVFYSVNENGVNWATGDTCRGRLHTQDNLNIDGNPDFKGTVTTKGKVVLASGSKPNFEQGHTNADVAIPTSLVDLNTLGNAGGTQALYQGLDVYVDFHSDGSVTVRTETAGTSTSGTTCWNESSSSKQASPNTTIPKCTTYANIAALTTSGVLLVQDGALHVKDTLKGQITLGAVDKVSGSGKSSVWIDGSVTYKVPPPSSRNLCPPNPLSTDMLGIVATNNISVSQYYNHDNSKGEISNITINGSMFSQNGSFGAENYNTRGADGKLTVVGGIQQQKRGAVGLVGGAHGFLKDYDFDKNLTSFTPKGYPKTPFVVQSWFDNSSIPNDFWQ